MKIYSFEKIECWQSARQLAAWVFKNTIDYSTEEKYGKVSQMRRASVSIALNIAEGSSRISIKSNHIFVQFDIVAR